MLKNEDRSGNVYENKGQDDNLPDTKGDISAWLHAILHRGASVLGNRRISCHYLSTGERTFRFVMWKTLEPECHLALRTRKKFLLTTSEARMLLKT